MTEQINPLDTEILLVAARHFEKQDGYDVFGLKDFAEEIQFLRAKETAEWEKKLLDEISELKQQLSSTRPQLCNPKFWFGDRVTADGDKSLVMVVVGVRFFNPSCCEYECSWFVHGETKNATIDEWRLEKND